MKLKSDRWIPVALLIIGGLMIIGGSTQFLLTNQRANRARAADRVTQLIFSSALDLPLLLTAGGDLLLPNDNNHWERAFDSDDVLIHNVYAGRKNGELWAATSAGLALYEGDEWQLVDDQPLENLIPLANDFVRITSADTIPTLHGESVYLPGNPDKIIVMQNDQNVIRSGEQVYVSVDVDQWQSLDTSEPIMDIWEDEDGNLLADTPGGVLRWHSGNNLWESAYPHSGAAPFEDFRVFRGIAFATVNGELLRFDEEAWTVVPLDTAAYLSELEVGQSNRLWALDTEGDRLWSTTDGETWSQLAIHIADSDLPPTK